MNEQIVKILKDKHDKSGGNCGTYMPEIINTLKIDYKTARSIIGQLYREGKVVIHDGAHGTLFFLKVEKEIKN